MRRFTRLMLSLLLVSLGACTEAQEQDAAASAERTIDWSPVIDSLIATIEAIHPDPHRHLERAAFEAEIGRIRESLQSTHDRAVAVRLMRLVGSIGDGHTLLEPGEEVGFDHWFPVRFYKFRDGVYITAVDSAWAGLAGSRVLKIGSLDAADAFDATSGLMGADNAFGRLEVGAVYLSSAPALAAIGAIDEPAHLFLEAETRSGRRTTATLPARQSRSSIGWRFWGEMFGSMPSSEDHMGDAYVTAFDGRAPRAFRSGDPALPRHLRYRLYYWFDHVPELDAVYMQWNFVQNDPEEPLAEFRRRLWTAFDSAGADRFILDLRYNSGGDGSMLLPFVHDLIRRESLDEPGKIVVLVGRKTFSAAIMLLAELKEHLPVVIVGEPPGAAANHFGDAVTVDLPHGFRLHVSTLYWQLDHPADSLPYEPVHTPAPFSGSDYFEGRDPALAAIEAGYAHPIIGMLTEDGPEAARSAYERRAVRYADFPWWRPFGEREMNGLGYDLLETGEMAATAITAFELNTLQYPDSWNVWDSYGDALSAAGRLSAARSAYARALELNPASDVTRDKLDELTGQADSG